MVKQAKVLIEGDFSQINSSKEALIGWKDPNFGHWMCVFHTNPKKYLIQKLKTYNKFRLDLGF